MRPAYRQATGFTLIEMMVAMTILAILVGLATPSFVSFLAKKRAEGVASEMNTDLHFARSEAVARNTEVRIAFGTNCYVIYIATATTATCTQTSKTITPATAEIKTVQLRSGSDASLAASAPAGSYLEYEPVRGALSAAPGFGTPALVEASSNSGNWRLGVCVRPLGRPATYSASGAGHVPGYDTSCPN